MKKVSLIASLCLLAGSLANAQVNNLNESGSLLVFPLIDNINQTTVIEISNMSSSAVWLEGYAILHSAADPTVFEKKDFFVHLSQKEPFWWDTSKAYNREDPNGIRTQIQGFDGKKGLMFLWAINDNLGQAEINFNYLQGNALLFSVGKAMQYNAIPHQALAITPDRILNLDGVEYTMATSQITFEGFSAGSRPGLDGTLAVASINIDFINSIQPEFDINFECWNQDEVAVTRHLDFYQFNQYTMSNELELAINQVFTPKVRCTTISNNAIWPVFFQSVGNFAWATNSWQQPRTGVPAVVILPPVPIEAGN